MAIGRDIYTDSRLILEKLEARFPDGAIGASQPDQKAVEKLLERWIVDGGVVLRASQLIPAEMPLNQDPKYRKDREDFSGRSWDKANILKMRPEALAQIRNDFDFLEKGLLADGRDWILKTDKPSLADIEAVWAFHWLDGLKGALPPSIISAKQFPKVFAWIDRFSKAVSSAKATAQKPTTLKGPEAIHFITQASFAETQGNVDEDPLGLHKGQDVEVWPLDSGFKHHDRGKLVALNAKEVVIATRTDAEAMEVRVHYPRRNFRIYALPVAGESKL
ncbi:hypothetical protein MMC30_005962 [Trapelia coarctata]|nr:hypothetical protein [Trapelia coarctata]